MSDPVAQAQRVFSNVLVAVAIVPCRFWYQFIAWLPALGTGFQQLEQGPP
jgi:hypothetical protein